MTAPLWAGIPAFCCAELLTLSWCQMASEADDFISFKGTRDLSAVPCRNRCASSSVVKPTRGAWHSSCYDPTKGPKKLGFQSNTANNLVSFTLSNTLFDLSHIVALCNTMGSGGPNASMSSVVMRSCAFKGRDYPALSLKTQRCLSGDCTGCWGDQEWFTLHQPLSPKLSMMVCLI